MLSNFIFGFLKIAGLRRRLIFYLKQKYFQEFGFEITLGQGLVAPIPYKDSYDSFSEIFIQQEYAKILKNIPLQHKWIDIGCHMGYFSLWMENRRKLKCQNKSEVLLIDADKRTEFAIGNLIKRNGIRNWTYQQGVIGSGKEINFYQKDYMASTTLKSNGVHPCKVRVLQQNSIEELLPGPYGMIKIDIEGSEWEFLNNYDSLIKKTNYLLIEWHSWHNGGGGKEQIACKVESLGFRIINDAENVESEPTNLKAGLILAEKTSLMQIS